ncbi:MAG: A/G-specific adenine glycosylase [Acidobacteria bacterium]|nr:A/G-specific adenine glycosylase [Acidobacteriota bacterium]
MVPSHQRGFLTEREQPRGSVTKPLAIAFRRALLRWYDRHRRDLPWRKTRDPYCIWVSEVMLQQTRVQTVVPYYEKFLRRFPTVEALASADEQTLLACWSGLGYYARARNLRKAARAIVREQGGQFPADLRIALRLPGIGGYTAAAVLSIAYGQRLPVLDGNVARVLARLFALEENIRTTSGKRKLCERAETLISPKRPGDFNQALMELGATICLPKQPRCDRCPVQTQCRAYLDNSVERYPLRETKAQTVIRRFRLAISFDEAGRCLLVRRPQAARWMGGFWELPMWEENHPHSEKPRPAGLHSPAGIRLNRRVGRFQHSITSNRLEVTVFTASVDRASNSGQRKWVPLEQVHRLPVTTITRKALHLLQRTSLAKSR